MHIHISLYYLYQHPRKEFFYYAYSHPSHSKAPTHVPFGQSSHWNCKDMSTPLCAYWNPKTNDQPAQDITAIEAKCRVSSADRMLGTCTSGEILSRARTVAANTASSATRSAAMYTMAWVKSSCVQPCTKLLWSGPKTCSTDRTKAAWTGTSVSTNSRCSSVDKMKSFYCFNSGSAGSSS